MKMPLRKCSGGVSFYPYSEAGTDFNSYMIQNHQDTVNLQEETSEKFEALQPENDLNLSQRFEFFRFILFFNYS
jgi:hypothetical protein